MAAETHGVRTVTQGQRPVAGMLLLLLGDPLSPGSPGSAALLVTTLHRVSFKRSVGETLHLTCTPADPVGGSQDTAITTFHA